MKIHDNIRIAKDLTGLSSQAILGSHLVNWKIGGYCKLDREEPTNHVHFHNCWEGHIVLSGSGVLKDEKGSHSINPGTILVTAPEIQHEIQVKEDESLSLLWFMLDIQPGEDSISNQDVESRLISNFIENHQAVNSDSREILSYLSFISEYKEISGKIDHWVIRIVQEMLLFFIGKLYTAPECITRQTIKPGNKTPSIFQNILDLISSDLERRFSVPELAEACGMSPRSIQYLFKRTLGITLTEYIAEFVHFKLPPYITCPIVLLWSPSICFSRADILLL